MITITKADNAGLLAKLNQEVQTLHHQWYPEIFKPYDYSEIEKAFEEMLGKHNVIVFVALDDSDAIGYILFFINPKEENAFQLKRSVIYIDQILVKESHRNRGIGAQLLHKVKEVAKTKQISTIQADHWIKNEDARKFFNNNGFECFREIRELKL